CCLTTRRPPSSTLFPYATLFRSLAQVEARLAERKRELSGMFEFAVSCNRPTLLPEGTFDRLHDIARATFLGPFSGEKRPFLSEKDRKSTRLNSSHLVISYAVFCL